MAKMHCPDMPCGTTWPKKCRCRRSELPFIKRVAGKVFRKGKREDVSAGVEINLLCIFLYKEYIFMFALTSSTVDYLPFYLKGSKRVITLYSYIEDIKFLHF